MGVLPLVSVEGLTHGVDEGMGGLTPVLRGIDLSVEAGEFVAIMGPNGSGKSTLVRHLNGLLLPTSGRVSIGGLDTRDAGQVWEIRRRVGMVFQNPDHQMVSPVVEEEVAFGLENLCLPPGEIRERVSEALAQVHLDHLRLANPGHLSGGQKQRLAIASILAMRPQVVVLDEPTSMLDPRSRREVLEAISVTRRVAAVAIILVTHSVEEALLADRVVCLVEGRVRIEGPPSVILSDGSLVEELSCELPALLRLAMLLREGGLDLPREARSPVEVAEGIDAAAARGLRSTSPEREA